MRELERPSVILTARDLAEPPIGGALGSVAVVGRGRLGTALSAALRGRGVSASGPLGRDTGPGGFDAVLLCVPDAEIAKAAAAVAPGPLVGHCSGATSLDPLAPHERFSLHPLMTFTAEDGAGRFVGAGAAIAGSTPRALAFARQLAETLEMQPFELNDSDRAIYHAAASIASNFLVTLEAAAERLAKDAGAERDALVPLVRATVENWARVGPEDALTGPVARGDEPTIAAQRAAIAERAPDLTPVFDVLVTATRKLAAGAQSPGLEPARR
jgi:predicted short-subunit dehydrogenase-like oxidoreductase (DUF2520 family)